MEGIHIALAPEVLGSFFGLPITNTLITSLSVAGLILAAAFIGRSKLKELPGRVQALFEEGLEFTLSYMEEVLEDKKLARFFFPLIVSLFIFIFASNVLQFLPGVGSIGFYHGEEFLPLFRSVNTDLNVTLALSMIVLIVIQIAGIATLGVLKYFSKFVSFISPLRFAIGIIDLFSEVARLVSFSFRLFGNIFAGEAIIAVVLYFAPLLLPVPVILFELFVGLIQAAIFALLTLFFIKLARVEAH